MKIPFFDCEGKKNYRVVVWTKRDGEIENAWTTLKEARAELSRIRAKRKDIEDSYIRLYDEDGFGVRDWNE